MVQVGVVTSHWLSTRRHWLTRETGWQSHGRMCTTLTLVTGSECTYPLSVEQLMPKTMLPISLRYIISSQMFCYEISFFSTSFGCLLWRGINLRECRKQSKLSFGKALQRGTAQVPSTSFLAWSLILQLCSCISEQSTIGHALVAQSYDRTWIAKVEHVYFSLEKQG